MLLGQSRVVDAELSETDQRMRSNVGGEGQWNAFHGIWARGSSRSPVASSASEDCRS